MSIKQKFKSFWKKLRGSAEECRERSEQADKSSIRANKKDSELSAEEITREEIFPEGKRRVCNGGKCGARKTESAKKPPSKRTRPTNGDYQMIDPSDDTVDTSQS